jgi:hypothetical protein
MAISSSISHSPRVRAFHLGRWFVTSGAKAALSGDHLLECFRRHAKGDFGDVCADDFEANLDAIAQGERILSTYRYGDSKVYVITEADRSVTTVLLAEEY